ncbi:hypothetical protein WH95_03780 [Kiloniella litopenaei]|uniref:DUF423 domain-containing protein n=1 Tax=Kiloniella litopenaei TaxID=1549748 RepID=A0A0M2RET9_9PROT|nr:DUF423 domain-containing protein [Kiloniella litopenaei]KKJ78530.1 hypothetical protein WH95_03780 [Kiloniella litopenaei]
MGRNLLRFFIAYAAIWGGICVAVSAYSAHGLNGNEARMGWAETGSFYGLVHVVALLVIVGLGELGQKRTKILVAACSCFSLGLLLFSGGLYIKALADISLGGPFIPVGGSLYILGWLVTALYGAKFVGKEDV